MKDVFKTGGESVMNHGDSSRVGKIAHDMLKSTQDPQARYSVGVDLITEGNVEQGLQILRDVAAMGENPSADAQTVAFANAVFVQLVQMHEMRMQMGDSLGGATVARLRAVRKAAQAAGDAGLAAQAALVLKRWDHRDTAGNPVIALLPESPLALQLEPTNSCNLRCTMCPRLNMKRPVGFMEPALFQQALEQWDYKLRVLVLPHLAGGQRIVLKRRGVLRLFFMGEPLLHPQIHEYIAVGRLVGCAVGIQTNGAAFARQGVANDILEAGPTSIGISLDGINPATYEAVRQGARWASIQEGLRNLAERRRQLGREKSTLISVCSILPEFTPEASQAALAFLEPIRPYVDSIGFIPLSRGRQLVFFDSKGQMSTREPETPGAPAKGSPLCMEALTKMHILWDGTATPCCYDIDGELVLGRVEQGVDNVWRGERAAALRQSLVRHCPREKMCLRCLGRTEKRRGKARARAR